MNSLDRREDTLTALDRRFSMHEAVCAERYENICKAAEVTNQGLSDLRVLVMRVAAFLIVSMLGLIGTLAWKALGW